MANLPEFLRRRVQLPAAVALTLFAVGAEAGIKCWTNAEGVRECGNAIPPEYAQQRSETLNERGVTVSTQQRAKTAAELEAERERAQREQAQREEEARRKAAQDAYDRVLLATYITEADILASRERKLAAIRATIAVAERSIEDTGKRIEDLKRRAAQLERSAQPIPAELADELQQRADQVADKRRYIAAREAEIATLEQEYATAIARFRELKADD